LQTKGPSVGGAHVVHMVGIPHGAHGGVVSGGQQALEPQGTWP
jgi:hypothetical protein